MRTVFRFVIVVFFSILLLSWGSLGHRTVGLIAEHHLNQKAKSSVQGLLGATTLAQVSTWADEVRNDPNYKHTGSWHYINLPMGLSRKEFDRKVQEIDPSVYTVVNKMSVQLVNPQSTQEQKLEALKFIVHFIGDLHQPMHVSREEDQGGNKIQVNYEGRGTNLHALWDSRLLEHEGLSDEQLAQKIDKASDKDIKTWQKNSMLDWLWESYQISSTLYSEVDQMSKRTITEEYYQKHIHIVEERLEKAGVRLAGFLNDLFSAQSIKIKVKNKEVVNPPQPPQPSALPQKGSIKNITLQEVGSYIGQEVNVCGKVYSDKALSGMTLVNLGADYPNQLLTIVLRDEAKTSWKKRNGSNICVKGKVIDYKGKPEIIVINSSNIIEQ